MAVHFCQQLPVVYNIDTRVWLYAAAILVASVYLVWYLCIRGCKQLC